MNRILIIIGCIICFLSCNQDKVNNKVNKELSFVVDELIRFDYFKVSVVQYETLPVFRKPEVIPDDSMVMVKRSRKTFHISYYYFERLIMKNYLDSVEANYMFSNIDTSTIYYLDSTLITKPLVEKEKIDSIFLKYDRDSSFNYIKSKYGSNHLIKFSSPIFNRDFTKMILLIDHLYPTYGDLGPIYGERDLLFLTKRNNKWGIIMLLGNYDI